MFLSEAGERGPHRIFSYVSYIHVLRLTCGDQTCNGHEVLPVCLHRVPGRFAGLAINQKVGKPVRERVGLGFASFHIASAAHGRGYGRPPPPCR